MDTDKTIITSGSTPHDLNAPAPHDLNAPAEMNEPRELSVGIDLGTTFSVVASLDRDLKPVTIANEEGDLSTPSVVYFDPAGPVVGTEAVNAAEFDQDRVARFAKRDVGSHTFRERILGYAFPPEVIQAIILQKLKDDAELKIGEFFKAVITVPAYFNEPRRKATQDAGVLAGLEVMDIINEPTAAAIAYGVNAGFVDSEGAAKSERVLVYDLGGGTFDVTLMDLKGPDFETVATAGDVHLGGMDWDMRIHEHLAQTFEHQHGIDPRSDRTSAHLLRRFATRAKKALSARESTVVRFAMGDKRSNLELTRAQFELISEDLVERTRMTVNRLLDNAGVGWKDISRLLLVGGSTRMPMIRQMLKKESGLEPDRSLSPDEAVAHGAAIYADILNRRGDDTSKPRLSVSNVNAHDLGVLGIDPRTKSPLRRLMIPRNTKIPVISRKKFVTSKDAQKEVVVTVVEGGTDSGQGATRIGKCRISGLPANLPAGSPVRVTFKYAADGRIAVTAELPDGSAMARTEIEREYGMTSEEIAVWKAKIKDGIRVDDHQDLPEPVEKTARPHLARAIPIAKAAEMNSLQLEKPGKNATRKRSPAARSNPRRTDSNVIDDNKTGAESLSGLSGLSDLDAISDSPAPTGASFRGVVTGGKAKKKSDNNDVINLDTDGKQKKKPDDSRLDSFLKKLD